MYVFSRRIPYASSPFILHSSPPSEQNTAAALPDPVVGFPRQACHFPRGSRSKPGLEPCWTQEPWSSECFDSFRCCRHPGETVSWWTAKEMVAVCLHSTRERNLREG
jgi:hypothetical protein